MPYNPNEPREPGGIPEGGEWTTDEKLSKAGRAVWKAAGLKGEPPFINTSTTDSWEKLAKPQKTAKQLADETYFTQITQGSEKQIKYAQDLRDNFLSNIKTREYHANVRWAVIKQTERNEKLENVDISILARDTLNRRTIRSVNTNDAKAIIDYFKSPDNQAKQIDAVGRYENIIKNPSNWQFDGKSWKRISYK